MISKSNYNLFYSKPSDRLSLSITLLKKWVLLTFVGEESRKFLQNMLTCDVYSLDKEHFSFSAHCNPFGKTLSCMYIFYYQNNLTLIVRSSVYESQLKEFSKYIKFFRTKVSVIRDKVLLGISGHQSRYFLCRFFNFLPNKPYSLINYDNVTILYFNLPTERFLVIADNNVCSHIQNQFNERFENDHQWISLDIESGYPILDKENVGVFIPQSFNLRLLKGISFNKGCYLGQEIISKSEYRNINKYKMFRLICECDYLPKSGDDIELKIKSSWKKVGRVLASCRVDKNKFWIQSIIKSNVEINSLYIKKDSIITTF